MLTPVALRTKAELATELVKLEAEGITDLPLGSTLAEWQSCRESIMSMLRITDEAIREIVNSDAIEKEMAGFPPSTVARAVHGWSHV